MVAVAEARALAILEELDAVEDSAADVPRALEGVGAIAGDHDRLLPGSEARLQALVAFVTEKAAPDRRNAHECDVQINKGIRRVARLGIAGCGLATGPGERLVHLADGEVQSAHRAVPDERLPVADLGFVEVHTPDRARRGRWCSPPGGAQPAVADQPHSRAHYAVAHYEDRDRRAAHDIDLRRALGPARDRTHGLPNQGVHRIDNAFFRDPHEDDRLLMVDELDAPDHAERVDADQHLNRLARVADRVREIRVEIDVPEEPVTRIGANERRLALGRAEAIGSREDLRRLRLRQKLQQTPGGEHLPRADNENCDRRHDEDPPEQGDAVGQRASHEAHLQKTREGTKGRSWKGFRSTLNLSGADARNSARRHRDRRSPETRESE